MSNTTRSFSNMLNEYLPNDMLKDELIKRDWFLTNVEKDENWKGGQIIVPFQGNAATSLKFAGLTTSSDIHEYAYVRGTISAYKELWGSMIFNQADLMQHDGKIRESTFLRILPDQVDAFMQTMKTAASVNLMVGPHFAKATDSTNGASGSFVVDHIDRFELGQHCLIDDDNSNETDAYVISIDINTKTVVFSATRGGSAANLSAYTTAQNAKFYHDGIFVSNAVTNNFTSLRSALLSSANGGSSTLHGQTKTAYPYLQAVNISGASITATNILDKLFDAFTEIRARAKSGLTDKCVMSFKNLGSVMKAIEVQKGAYKVTATTSKASMYGWTEIELTGVKGGFTLVGIQEMDDDIIFFLDMSAMTFRSNGMIKKRKAPDGKEYFEVRNTTGYQYILDLCLFGELEVRKPCICGVVYSISY
jgi:hypothetical protein